MLITNGSKVSMKYIIRTSDRKKFKECRLAWDLGSKIRQNLEPIGIRTPLDFGTEIHAGLERWYDPALWDGPPGARAALSQLAFQEQWRKHRMSYERNGVLSVEAMDDMLQRKELGTKMLEYYFLWSAKRDKGLTPIYTEIEFEVPIMLPTDAITLPEHFGFSVAYGLPTLTYRDREVVYQGRIDLIVQDSDGYYWLVDHKTAGRFEDNTEFLVRDEQCKSYAWALGWQLGINVRGVIYNELYKGIPEAPARLNTIRKGLSFSTNKTQDTTFELALETFKAEDRAAFRAGLYDPYLTFLRTEGREFCRRNRITYTPEMLEILGNQICLEAIDMLSDPYVYPSPDRWKCRWCDFRTPCESLLDGQPIDWMKETMYIKRSDQLEVTSN
jgi:hypothetical protein